MLSQHIRELAENNMERIVGFRRRFHMHPELGGQEIHTARAISDELKRLGLSVTEGVAGTGVVGILEGSRPGKTVLLRADMDALPIQEHTDVPYKSQVECVMHACGHDGHSASLLGTAMVLSALKEELPGCVKFVFQPDEEYGEAAKTMVNEGILENPKVDAAFAMHLWGDFPEGQVLVRHGPIMSAPDKFIFKVIGKGGHASTPHLTVDPVMITVQAINNMQAIISRRKDPFEPAVISYCSIEAQSEYNTIPEEVEVSGTIRTFDPALRKWIIEAMEQTLRGTAESQGAKVEFRVDEDFALPAVINDEELTDIVKHAAEKVIGKDSTIVLKNPLMSAEDYAFFSQAVRSSFFLVGIAPEGKEVVHHSPDFAWDDRVLYTSVCVMSQTVIDFLSGDA